MAAERLKKQDILQLLRSEQVNLLSEASKTENYSTGEMIYQQGQAVDRFYIILDGQVALRLPGKGGLNVLIDELTKGDMFGGCVTTQLDAYALNAQCTEDSQILVVSVSALKSIMDEDPRIGYIIQSRISEIYFRRYIETMEKLQAIVMNIPAVSL